MAPNFLAHPTFSRNAKGWVVDMNDELSLRKLLGKNMLNTTKAIAESKANLEEWRYTIFRAEGLREGDKGILAYRKKSSPYVVTYNNLVMSSTIAILRMSILQLAPSL